MHCKKHTIQIQYNTINLQYNIIHLHLQYNTIQHNKYNTKQYLYFLHNYADYTYTHIVYRDVM